MMYTTTTAIANDSPYMWRLCREFLVKGDLELEGAALPRRVFWSEDDGAPVHYVIVLRRGGYSGGWVRLELLQIAKKSFAGNGGHVLVGEEVGKTVEGRGGDCCGRRWRGCGGGDCCWSATI